MWQLIFFVGMILIGAFLLWLTVPRLSLKMPLRPVDLIVVFSGGGGERVEEAVRLYNAGYASRILMSGGGHSFHSQAYLMKEHAIFLGVSPDVILLEESARSTYENAKFTSAILNDIGVESLILVTSRYHTRRSFFWMSRFWDSDHIVVAGAEDGVNYQKWWMDYEMVDRVLLEWCRFIANGALIFKHYLR